MSRIPRFFKTMYYGKIKYANFSFVLKNKKDEI